VSAPTLIVQLMSPSDFEHPLIFLTGLCRDLRLRSRSNSKCNSQTFKEGIVRELGINFKIHKTCHKCQFDQCYRDSLIRLQIASPG